MGQKMNANNCPIKSELEKATKLGNEFAKVMRKLRREIEVCDTCTKRGECDIREKFDRVVDEVITELNQDWGLL